MNLGLFTVELERHGAGDRRLRERPAPASRPRQRPTLRWMGLALAVLICVAAAAAGGWVLAGGTPLVGAAFGLFGLANESAVYSADDRARVEITSQPAGAVVFVDGRQKGNTPVVLSVSKAMHRLVLKHPEAVDDQRLVTVSSDMNVSVRMWRRQPDALQLRPTYPGASISDAAFLADGRLALSMALPVQAGGLGGRVLHEEWIFDPNNGSFQPFDAAGAIRAAVLVVSPDGRSVAYLRGEQSNAQSGAGGPRLGEVWVAVSGNSGLPVRAFALSSMSDTLAPGSPLAEVEELHDVAWTPDGAHLLVTAQLVSIAGGYPAAPRSRLLLIEAPVENQQSVAPPIELVTLPATVVPGSYTWAPDGHWVAFLTQASGGPGSADFVALCAVDTSAGGAVNGFRYVADLVRQPDPTSLLPIASVAWAPMPDGRLVYTAATPKITVTNPLGLPMSSGGDPGLFVATPAGPALSAEEGRRFGPATGLIAPAWRAAADPYGPGLLALSRSQQGSKPLVIRGINAVDGTDQNLDIELPSTVGASRAVTARWDLAHGRLLIVAHPDGSTAGVLDYWLVQLQTASGNE